MIDHLLSLFSGPQKTPDLSPSDSRTALAALLVRVARADDQYDMKEIDAILRVLRGRYNLSATEAEKLRAEAEDLESKAPDTVRFTRAIKDAVPYEDRRTVIEAMWSIAMADGERDYNEDGLLRLVSSLCGDGDTCAGDSCDPKTGGCAIRPRNQGKSCSDGDACTIGDNQNDGTRSPR